MRQIILLFGILVCAILLSGCVVTTEVVVTATPTAATIPPATDTPAPVTDTPAPATDTPAPTTDTPAPTAERVTFGAGESTATRSGSVAAGTPYAYVLEASAGQVMDVLMDGSTGFVISAPDGMLWASDAFGYDSAMGVKTVELPVAGDYVVEVQPVGAGPAQPYEITFTVLTPPSPGDEPERVTFEAGATDAARRSALTPTEPKQYLLNAEAGQEMSIYATSRSVPFHFVVTAPDGTNYESEQLGSEVQVRATDFTLLVDGDYLISVAVDSPTEPLLFDITFEITGDAGAVEPERVTFDAGATSATRSGTLDGDTPAAYVLEAAAGQIMEVITSGNPAGVDFVVTDPNGTEYPVEHVEFFGLTRIVIELPVAGDAVTRLTKAAGTNALPSTDYEVTFTVLTPKLGPEVVAFEPGATSASRRGALASGGTTDYALNAAAGQRLSVRTTSFDALVNVLVASPSGAHYTSEQLGSEVYIAAAELILPENGLYLIRLSTPLAAPPAFYDIIFDVTGSTGAVEPERVAFEPGATSATLTGIVPGGINVKSFVLGVGAGQSMTVEATTDGAPFTLTISDLLNGEPLAIATTPDFGSGSADLILPATGDYFVSLLTPLAAGDTGYTVTIMVE